MRRTYSEIFNVALSSISNSKKIKILNTHWNKINEKELFYLAKQDELSSHIATILRKSNIKYMQVWDKEYIRVKNEIDILMKSLDSVASVLGENNIKVVALKNAGITRGLYKNHACSPMGDIDLLIKSNDFKKSHHLITEKLGYTFKLRSDLEEEDYEIAFRDGGTEYYKYIKGHKVWLELQWRPIAGRWIQPHNEPDGNQLIENSIKLEDSYVRILAPEDNLLQVSLHTAKHSYVRAPGFRLHSDVDRVIRFQKINWEKFIESVKEKKLITSVYFSLYFAKLLINTPIPSSVLKKLEPVFYRKYLILLFIKKAGYYNKNKKKFSRIGYIIFNLCLYDSIQENFKALFPSYESMVFKYKIKSKVQLPFYYLLRFKNLIFKRANL